MTEYAKLTDDQLVRMYTEGDAKAFDALLDRYDAVVHTYIRFSISDTDIAEDIFQDTFVKVIMTLKRGLYTAEGKFKAWLLRIAHNLIMDHYRREKTDLKWQAPREESRDPLELIGCEEPNAEEKISHREQLSELYMLLTRLPMEQREVLMLRYWQDMSFKEIADHTGVSINTALGRMRYALINLRRMAVG
ncbi:RNA polymerase sigma-70 factor, ECF subfamily [Porphyromonas crevioricanis JCM 15906]|uniref:RNA polymerase sigma-70 factor, ECF subfamily n=1 Tax=Porphyromonas crevioricanis JCM 15906 TaxID=1305617 RepID=T1CGN3_9PORP|nr:sigma-70 family RNA polymerase sigma factor [Porphyromonas crevioricanis]GAD04876.1 RNA polymerase sigma-70 factor, ECF subfamily [Porphyromonas crevioricanis JCM 15906]SJZ95678.1 RNA polymerase sigma-70 factor, ECF subfamily [Porphyromonas crevioricanis]